MTGKQLYSLQTKYLRLDSFSLESGIRLSGVQIAFRTWGRLDAAGRNGVLICHALTGSADADDWWKAMFGEGRAFDPEEDFIVCSNILGSCYGTTGPASPRTGRRQVYGPDFPAITIRDMVHLQARLLKELGVRRLRLVAGGSLGGMQTLEWAALYPEMVEAIAPVGISGRHSGWAIGLSEAQRQAIMADAAWQEGRYPPDQQPVRGLSAARMMAMCTYRSHESFQRRFGRDQSSGGYFQAETYLRYQGEKLTGRFDANCYLTLTRAMDSHDLGRGRGGYPRALKEIRQPALVVSISSDILYPPAEQQELASLLPRAELASLDYPWGHDAFLIEVEHLSRLVRSFRDRVAGSVEALLYG